MNTRAEGGLNKLLHMHRRPSSKKSAASSSQLHMVGRGGAYAYYEPMRDPSSSSWQPQPSQPRQWAEEYIATTPDLEVPTFTQKEPSAYGVIPPRPKIVVFGASGRLGRRIVKRLLSSNVDMDVIAFVRDAKKLDRVLYDEEDFVMTNAIEGGMDDNNGSNDGGVKKRGGGGPKLQVVVGDVVSKRDVYRGRFETDNETKVLDVWVDQAKRYFANKGWKYDNSTSEINSFEDDEKVANDIDVLESGGEEALRDVISGSTVLISCLGTFRPSNLWTDYIRVPILRVFRRNASKWCSDPRHPYYVNYLSTKKILEEAENEQKRRDAFAEFEKERLMMEEQMRRRGRRSVDEEEGFESEIAAGLRKKRSAGLSDLQNVNGNGEAAVSLPENGLRPTSSDRIKFIRVSNLMVGHNPFRIWNVITNVLWSQLSRFEEMGEMMMESSKLVDTIVLRPGEMTDDERNLNHTSLQLCIDGKVDSPSLVGREDVADLAVVSALTKTDPMLFAGGNVTDSLSQNETAPVQHYTWALRWTGQYLSPPQGLRPDGLSSAALCFVKAVKEQTKVDAKRRLKEQALGKELITLKRRWRRSLKPFAQSLAISIPLYCSLMVVSWYLFGPAFIELFSRLRRLSIVQTILQMLLKLSPRKA